MQKQGQCERVDIVDVVDRMDKYVHYLDDVQSVHDVHSVHDIQSVHYAQSDLICFLLAKPCAESCLRRSLAVILESRSFAVL